MFLLWKECLNKVYYYFYYFTHLASFSGCRYSCGTGLVLVTFRRCHLPWRFFSKRNCRFWWRLGSSLAVWYATCFGVRTIESLFYEPGLKMLTWLSVAKISSFNTMLWGIKNNNTQNILFIPTRISSMNFFSGAYFSKRLRCFKP